MSKPTVLHVSTWKTACGIATYCDNIRQVTRQMWLGKKIFALYPSEWVDYLASDIVDWRNKLLNASAGCDLVHIQHEHGLFGYSQGQSFACRRYESILAGLRDKKIPCVTTFHTDIVTNSRRGISGLLSKFRKFRKRRMWKRGICRHFGAGKGAGKAIVHSMRTRKSFVKNGFPIDSVTVVPHPCLPPRLPKFESSQAKAALGLPTDCRLVTIFGFVDSYKGHDYAIKAISNLPENYQLAIVGGMHPESKDDFLGRIIESLSERTKSRVRITGWVDGQTAEHYFSATDVCVAPYRGNTELSGSGAITWALSSGKPVIASKIDAFQSVNRKRNCMFMITPDCTTELVWAIQKVDNDEALKKTLIENATRFCEENSWDASVENVLSIYKQQGLEVPSASYPALAKVA